MPQPSTHAVLVSNQPVPSLTPLLDPALKVKHVHLLHTPERLQHAGWLRTVLDKHNITSTLHPLRDGYDMNPLETDIDAVFDALEGPVAVNITGGSKLMSLVAHAAATKRGWPGYYIRLRDDSLLWLHEHHRPPHPVADRIGLEDFLLAHGIRLAEKPQTIPEPNTQRLARTLLRSTYLREELHRLRSHLTTMERAGLKQGSAAARNARELLNHLEQAGLATSDEGRWRFMNHQAYNFTTGGWLEVAVYDILDKMRPQMPRLHDLAMGIKVVHPGEKMSANPADTLSNELDIACLHDNTLHLIECKTGNLSGVGYSKQSARDVAYQLETLREQLGGLRSRAMLLSLNNLTRNQRGRAERIGIQVVDGGQIGHLPEILRSWFQSPKSLNP